MKVDRPVHCQGFRSAGTVLIWLSIAVMVFTIAEWAAEPDRGSRLVKTGLIALGLAVIGAVLKRLYTIPIWWTVDVPESSSNPPSDPGLAGTRAPVRPRPAPVLAAKQDFPEE